jgi:hypothetical protein
VSDHTKQKNDLLSSTVDTRIAGLETVISVKFSSVIEKELGSLHTLVMSEVGDRIRELEKNFLEKLELQKLDFEKRFEAVNEKQIESKKAIATLNRKTRELEIFKYSQKGQMGAIYGSIELLKEDIDAKNWKIEGDLEDLSKEIEGVNLKSEVITQIEEQLARLDDAPKYKYLIDQVKEMYKKKE